LITSWNLRQGRFLVNAVLACGADICGNSYHPMSTIPARDPPHEPPQKE
jgi:hypothetical protein